MEQGEYKTEYEIAELVKLRLFQSCHGLAPLLGQWTILIGDWNREYWTEGMRLYLDSTRLKEEFLKGSEGLCLELLHMLSHWLLCHPFLLPEGRQKGTWELACDLAAWLLTWQLWNGKGSFTEWMGEVKKGKITEALDSWLEEKVSQNKELTAIELYDLLTKQAEEKEGLSELELSDLLYVDSHTYWKRSFEFHRLAKASGDMGKGSEMSGQEQGESKELSQEWWEFQYAKLKQEYLAGKKRQRGTGQRKRTQHLIPAAGHRGDYRDILQSFASFREDSRINQEEFQYAWYEYGLEIYGNMPLIEPLEYKEERKIEDLVLVIDTSGSCEKELVRIFLEETKGILEQEDLFFSRFCLHIIQCDNQIQRDDKITGIGEFESYLEDLQITGGGGTDFCPAFQRIGELERAGEFQDLKGILYFTDGLGIYPKEAPDYEVYFVMVEGSYDAIDIPDWIHCLVLKEA